MGLDERPGNPLQHVGVGHGRGSSQWRYSHNYRHHVFTNVVGIDDDLGFGVMRVTRDQPWQPAHLLQPLRNLLLASIFEWGIAPARRSFGAGPGGDATRRVAAGEAR